MPSRFGGAAAFMLISIVQAFGLRNAFLITLSFEESLSDFRYICVTMGLQYE